MAILDSADSVVLWAVRCCRLFSVAGGPLLQVESTPGTVRLIFLIIVIIVVVVIVKTFLVVSNKCSSDTF